MSLRSAFFLFSLLAIPVLAFLFLRIFGENQFREIPVFYQKDLPQRLDCSKERMPNFHLTDRLGGAINSDVFDNKISVVNFFHPECLSGCQRAMDQQARVYNHFLDHPLIQFLSISLEPGDTLTMHRYQMSFRPDPMQWIFVTGDLATVLDLAHCGLVIDTEADGFMHGEADLVVMDGKKRIRGYYDPNSDQEVDRLITEIQILALDYNR